MRIHLRRVLEFSGVSFAVGSLFGLSAAGVIRLDSLVLVLSVYLFLLPTLHQRDMVSKPRLLGYAVQAGHVVWLVYVLAHLGNFQIGLFDISIIGVGLTWYIVRPSWFPVALLTLHHAAMSLLVRSLQFGFVPGNPLSHVAIMDLALRVLSLVYLAIGYRSSCTLRGFLDDLLRHQAIAPEISHSTLVYYPHLLRELPGVLEDGECAEAAVSGRYRGKGCVLAVTDRRLIILIGSGRGNCPQMESIRWPEITGYAEEKAFISGRVSVQTVGNAARIGSLTRLEAEEITVRARPRLSESTRK
ncbi:hypothetical protein ACFLQ0_00525 [Nitrospinota bacterium]